MEKIPYTIAQLYYNYKRTSDEKIDSFLKNKKIFVAKNQQYLELTTESVQKLIEKKRKVSLTFNVTGVKPDHNTTIKPWKEFCYLVKSTSRFFLKPDIGEILDQIPREDLYDVDLTGILFINEHELLEGTQGEHFLMKAMLLKSIDKLNKGGQNA